MKRKYSLAILFLGICISFAVTAIVIMPKENQKQSPNEISGNKDTTPSPEITFQLTRKFTNFDDAISLTEIPRLYPGFSWKRITDQVTLPSPYLKFNGKPIVLNGGQEWVAETNTDKDWVEFTKYYDTKYKQLGWRYKVMVNEMIFEFQGAEGPTGWVQGFVGTKEDKFRVFYYHTAKINVATQKEDIQCPCYEKYTLYLSDIIPLDRLSSLVESQN